MATLLLLRHGQSQWNVENRFAGWSDIPLTERGMQDAATVGKRLQGYSFDLAWTSRLKRAYQTLDIVLHEMHLSLPIQQDSALNERHYGDLQGLNKAESVEKFGKEQVQLWRRDYETRPPSGESIADCDARIMRFFSQMISPSLFSGKNIILVAHGVSLRPIMSFLEGKDIRSCLEEEVGLCTPYVYTFDRDQLQKKEIIDIPEIVTLGASLTDKSVPSGRL